MKNALFIIAVVAITVLSLFAAEQYGERKGCKSSTSTQDFVSIIATTVQNGGR